MGAILTLAYRASTDNTVTKVGYLTALHTLLLIWTASTTQLINLAIQTAALPSVFAIGSAVSAIAARGTNISGTYCLFILALPPICKFNDRPERHKGLLR